MEPIKDVIATRNVEKIKAFMEEHDLILLGSKIVPRDGAAKAKLMMSADFWNQRQQARKILLNSLN